MHICGIQKNGTDEPISKAGMKPRCREWTCGHGARMGMGGRGGGMD